ncbi:hypothetical protein MIMGU_mgv1a011159mg [Erythranthe guttata]|uniref:Uncharacterized protein n=1 Tax=Erythranthe guttata TaxID=4155 RepID=A0A022QPS8_ERYGU|nr:hypothetical protein MIMGU_mgv1a011159mg [Erythranthe guttata]
MVFIISPKTMTTINLPLYLKPSPNSHFLRRNSPPISLRRSSLTVRSQALGEPPDSAAVYQGVYGPWKVDSADVQEVVLYRSGLVTAASSFVIASSTAFLYSTDSEGLWLIGGLGSLAAYAALAQPAGKGLVEYVVLNPAAVWLVGPLFAALTGLVFKEGLCYGKLEAGILTFIIPSVLLGHLSGLMDEGTKLSLLGVWMALFVVFAGRKFTQPIKDDIGDKSVFIFKALPEKEKAALIEKLEQQNYPQNRN